MANEAPCYRALKSTHALSMRLAQTNSILCSHATTITSHTFKVPCCFSQVPTNWLTIFLDTIYSWFALYLSWTPFNLSKTCAEPTILWSVCFSTIINHVAMAVLALHWVYLIFFFNTSQTSTQPWLGLSSYLWCLILKSCWTIYEKKCCGYCFLYCELKK